MSSSGFFKVDDLYASVGDIVLCFIVRTSESDPVIYRLYFEGLLNFNAFSSSGQTFIFEKHMLHFVPTQIKKSKIQH